MNSNRLIKWTTGALLAWLALLGTAQAQITAQAFLPESGFYWNPAEPGRGYAIEIQDRFVFITLYTYTEENQPAQREALWFFSAGNIVPGQSGNGLIYTFSEDLSLASAGQCLGCDFVANETDPTGRPISITFDSLTTASLVINGETIAIERFWYSPSINDTFASLLGQWIFAIDCTASNASGNCYPSDLNVQPFNGDFLELFELNTGNQTTVDGFRSGTAIRASAAFDPAENLYVIVVSETGNEFLAYYFFGADFGTDQILGFAERFSPGDDLQLNGFLMWGQRISDRTYVEEAFGKATKTATRLSGLPRPGVGKTRLGRADLLAGSGLDKSKRERLKASLNQLIRSLEPGLAAPPTRRR